MSITNYFLNTQTNGLYINYPRRVNNVDTLDSNYNGNRTPPYLVSEKWGSLIIKCNVGAGFTICNNTDNITAADPFFINFASQEGQSSDIKVPGNLQFTTLPAYNITMTSSGVTIISDVTVNGFLNDNTFSSNSSYAVINKATEIKNYLNVPEIRSQTNGFLNIGTDVKINGKIGKYITFEKK